MPDAIEQGQQIKSILDNELKFENFSKHQDPDEEASLLFKRIFVEVLGFDESPGIPGDQIPVHDWRDEAEVERAYTIAEKGSVRIIYLISNKVSRTAQRYAVTALTKQGWAQKGNFVAIFHSNDDPEEWHLVSPNVTDGRTILQRYVAGVGENHRTLSENLARLDASLPEPLHERVVEAFRVKTVTREFYEDYKRVFQQLKDYLAEQLQPKQSKRYAHLLLNRLMFIYFLQKKGWLAEKKDFMSWFVQQYRRTGKQDEFHRGWLDTLFFKAMSKPAGEKELPSDLPGDVTESLDAFPFFNGGLFEREDVDNTNITLPDEIILETIEKFLDRYNFTIKEESPFDVDVAVDPAMLGKIYESLIAEEERGKAGIFYTPRVEVDLMCRLGLLQYLTGDDTDDGEEGAQDNATVRDRIIEFLFTPLEDWQSDQHKELRSLKDKLDSVTVCDPACGSGAFLVGMLQALMDLYRKIGIEPDYKLKERIIYRTIHGADIKDWAIRMAEFRLWLSLIEGEDQIPSRSGEAILPNFSFNLRRGDSIVQKVGDEYIRLDLSSKHVIADIKDKLDELKELRHRFYFGEKELKETIYKKQVNILKTYIDKKIEDLKSKRRGVRQTNLQGEVSEESQKKYHEMTAQIEQLERQKEQLDEAASDRTFIWGLDFLEPMSEGGFDVVIANPPYVRQEQIIDPQYDPEEISNMPSSRIKKIKDTYKSAIQEYVKQIWQENISKSSDIYVHFFYKGLELTKQGGGLVYISSNSWLDVKFGQYLQKGLLKYSSLKSVVDCATERSFEEADVNTVITVAQRNHPAGRLTGDVSFTTFRKPFEWVATPRVLKGALSHNYSRIAHYEGAQLRIESLEDYRRVEVDEEDLWKLGEGKVRKFDDKNPFASGDYTGEKWGGRFLRAPDIFFTLIERGKGKLVKLKEVADIRFGIKTGANEFFYLKPLKHSVNEVVEYSQNYPSKHVTVRNQAGWEGQIEAQFLKPVLRSPRELKTIEIHSDYLGQLVFLCPSSIENLKSSGFKGALNFIRWGEEARYICQEAGCNYRGTNSTCPRHGENKISEDAFPKRPTCASRTEWWNIGDHREPLAIWFKSFNDRFLVPSNGIRALSSDRFYEIHARENTNIDTKLLIIAINSTLLALIAELTGRVNLGEGALDNMTYEAADNLILNPEYLAPNKNEINAVFDELSNRKILSIFEELGLPQPNNDYSNINPNDLKLESVRQDRRKLDKAIFEAIGLTEEEQLEVYKSVVEMVKNRLLKAQSV